MVVDLRYHGNPEVGDEGEADSRPAEAAGGRNEEEEAAGDED